MDLHITDVPPVAEISEVVFHEGVLNGKTTVIWSEILLGYIRLMLGSVWQYVIPGTVLGWPRTGHGFVPRIASLKVRIDIDDYTSIVEQVVLHDVTN